MIVLLFRMILTTKLEYLHFPSDYCQAFSSCLASQVLHFLAASVQETPDELRVWESKSKALDLSQDHFDGNF